MDIIQEILAGLKHNLLRTVLTGLSVSWGIFILIILLGAGNGLKNGVTSNFRDRATNTVQMWPGQTSLPFNGLKSGRSLEFSENEIGSINRNIKESSGATGIVQKGVTISYKKEFGNYQMIGANVNYEKIFNLKFGKNGGRFVNTLDLNATKKVIILDQKIVDVLFKDEPALGKYVKVGDIMFQVIGINSKKARWGNGNAYIPFTTAQTIYNSDKKFSSIAMTVNGLNTKEDNDAFNDKLTGNMARSMNFDPKDTQALNLWNAQRDYIETMKIFGGITLFVSIIGIFTLIAGIVGVSNIMLVSVKERTREIGIRKAIGAPPASILRSIVIEAILITTIFGYIGMMFGVGLTEIISMVMEQSAAGNPDGMSVFKDPTVSLSYVLVSTSILIISGIIAGYLPARRAVKIKPIEAMREE